MMFDYEIICDETLNTPDVVENNEFRARIKITPNPKFMGILQDWQTEMTVNPEFLKKLFGNPKKYRSIDDPWEAS